MGTRAQFEILNNKPIQGLCHFFVRTIDTVSFSQTKVPARGNPWLFSIWEASSFPWSEFQAEAATADPEGVIDALMRNRGLSPRRSSWIGVSLWPKRSHDRSNYGSWVAHHERILPGSFVSLAARGSKLENEKMEGLAF